MLTNHWKRRYAPTCTLILIIVNSVWPIGMKCIIWKQKHSWLVNSTIYQCASTNKAQMCAWNDSKEQRMSQYGNIHVAHSRLRTVNFKISRCVKINVPAYQNVRKNNTKVTCTAVVSWILMQKLFLEGFFSAVSCGLLVSSVGDGREPKQLLWCSSRKENHKKGKKEKSTPPAFLAAVSTEFDGTHQSSLWDHGGCCSSRLNVDDCPMTTIHKTYLAAQTGWPIDRCEHCSNNRGLLIPGL